MSANLNNTNNLSHLVTTHVNAILAYWDKEEVCRFANASYKEWLGKTPEEIVEKMTIKEVLGEELYKRQEPIIRKVLNGEKQAFEREFKLPNGQMRQAFITYYPDNVNGDVKGFVVHGVDITAVKTVEAKILAQEKAKNNQILQSIIQAQEAERESVAAQLRDNISQTLSYCKIMLESHNKDANPKADGKLLFDIFDQISGAVSELVTISSSLSSSVILHFGLTAALEDLIAGFQKTFKGEIDFNCLYDDIENISDKRKTSIFRIIQNFLLLVKPLETCKDIHIYLTKIDDSNFIELQLKYAVDNEEIDLTSREFSEMQTRISLNNGTLTELKKNGFKILSTKLDMVD